MTRPETTPTSWQRARADGAERIDGAARFVGQMIGLLGGVRQVGFALALTMLAGGLGDCLSAPTAGDAGASWMAVGGLLLGLVVPAPGRRR